MTKILLLAEESRAAADLRARLTASGFACVIARAGEEITAQIAEQAPDLVVIEASSPASVHDLSARIKQETSLPVIAIVPEQVLTSINGHLDTTDDFIIKPGHTRELELRIKRLLPKGNGKDSERIQCGDLLIDLATYNVTVAGKLVELTFKEYELLKFLASHPGRVFTRQSLLDQVWGYDYFGGDRTVDVHVTRLRNKLEDPTHTFIETVRNIGYRFRKEP
ncbi:MAG: response regulator transcription factor [Chloroflexi bacterium]|nr:response regulator transcription factor [Chloroflexota bacterium]